MSTFDEAARRAAADLHEQVRPAVRASLPPLPRRHDVERRRWLLPAAALLVIGALLALSIVLSHPDRRVVGTPSTPAATGSSTLAEDCFAQGQLRGQLSVTIAGNGRCGVTMAATISFDNETGQECSSGVMATIDPGGINMLFNSTSGFGGATGEWVPMGTPEVDAEGVNNYPVGVKVWDITLPALTPGEYRLTFPTLQCGFGPTSFPFTVGAGAPPPTSSAPATTTPLTTSLPDTTSVVTATRLTMSGSAQELCDTAERTLDPNHSPWITTVLSDQPVTWPSPGRWLFCQGDPAGITGVVAMHGDFGGVWWAAGVGGGPLFHAGDAAVSNVIDSEVATVVVDHPVGELRFTATTNDSGGSWTVVREQLATPPATTTPGPVAVIDEFRPSLVPVSAVYQGEAIVSQPPAAAFVTGVGVVGTLAVDADRHFDLAIVGNGRARTIGVRVQFTPALAGGPDGRLYVADQGTGTFAAYAVRGGKATLVAGPVSGTCDLISFEHGTARCGASTLPLGTYSATTDWRLTLLHDELPADTQLGAGRSSEPGGVRYDLPDGIQLWLVPFSGGGAGRTAVIVLDHGHQQIAQVAARIAAVDVVHHVLYGWDAALVLHAFDYSSLLG
jgi:hypothetical protein